MIFEQIATGGCRSAWREAGYPVQKATG